MLIPMIEQAQPYRTPNTLVTADAGYHSDANVQHLKDHNIPALIADNQMRKRDERVAEQGKYKGKDDPLYDKRPTGGVQTLQRFKPQDFKVRDDSTCICPAGMTLKQIGTSYTNPSGQRYQLFKAQATDCQACALRHQCLRDPQIQVRRYVTKFEPHVPDTLSAQARIRCAIDSAQGRQLYSQRIGTVEPVFGNLRHNKRLTRLNHRGRTKVNTQWHLYCMVHNIEKLSKTGLGQPKGQ